LRRKDIHFAKSIFQPRQQGVTSVESEYHLRELMYAIRVAKDHVLDPLLVWWSGDRWRVVDGHHRMEAYDRLAADEKRPLDVEAIPVEVFEGSLEEAMMAASQGNKKDKKAMTRADKLERAWRFVTMQRKAFTNPAIVDATGISDRTITTMRKRLAELLKHGEGDFGSSVDVLNLTWESVKKMDQGVRPPMDGDQLEDQIAAEAREWARRLGHEFRRKLADAPDITARALELYSENLVKRLCDIWRDAMDDVDGDEEGDELPVA
jgi:hypothetical protein